MPLVGVRREVVAEAEHAFGNLFHRLHYFATKLQGQGVEGATSLESTVAELEDLLRLVLDYASPLAAEVVPVRAAVVVGGLAAALGRGVTPLGADCEARLVLADSRLLSEAFRLMKVGLGSGEGEAGGRLEARSRGLAVSTASTGVTTASPRRSAVAWALAQKLVEAQGGIHGGGPTAVRARVRLPLAAGEMALASGGRRRSAHLQGNSPLLPAPVRRAGGRRAEEEEGMVARQRQVRPRRRRLRCRPPTASR